MVSAQWVWRVASVAVPLVVGIRPSDLWPSSQNEERNGLCGVWIFRHVMYLTVIMNISLQLKEIMKISKTEEEKIQRNKKRNPKGSHQKKEKIKM